MCLFSCPSNLLKQGPRYSSAWFVQLYCLKDPCPNKHGKLNSCEVILPYFATERLYTHIGNLIVSNYFKCNI